MGLGRISCRPPVGVWMMHSAATAAATKDPVKKKRQATENIQPKWLIERREIECAFTATVAVASWAA